MKHVKFELPWMLSRQELRKRATGNTKSLEDFLFGTEGEIIIQSDVKKSQHGSALRIQYGLKMFAKAKQKPMIGNSLTYWMPYDERTAYIFHPYDEQGILSSLNEFAIKKQKDLKASFDRDVHVTYAQPVAEG